MSKFISTTKWPYMGRYIIGPKYHEKKHESEGDKCPHCGEAELIIVGADEPWSCEHLACPNCDSTFPL